MYVGLKSVLAAPVWLKFDFSAGVWLKSYLLFRDMCPGCVAYTSRPPSYFLARMTGEKSFWVVNGKYFVKAAYSISQLCQSIPFLQTNQSFPRSAKVWDTSTATQSAQLTLSGHKWPLSQVTTPQQLYFFFRDMLANSGLVNVTH